MDKVRGRYLWDKRPGYYFIEWWEGKKRKRSPAGTTPTEAIDANRRKSHELIGEMVSGSERVIPDEAKETNATRIDDAIRMFLEHIKVHSPDKPNTHRRCQIVLEHFERILGKRKYMGGDHPGRHRRLQGGKPGSKQTAQGPDNHTKHHKLRNPRYLVESI